VRITPESLLRTINRQTCYPPWILVLVCCLKSKERYSNPTGHPKVVQHGSTQSNPTLGQITGLNVAKSKESSSNPPTNPLKSGVMRNVKKWCAGGDRTHDPWLRRVGLPIGLWCQSVWISNGSVGELLGVCLITQKLHSISAKTWG